MYVLVRVKKDDSGFNDIEYIIDYSETIDKFRYKLNSSQYDSLMKYGTQKIYIDKTTYGVKYTDTEFLIYTPKMGDIKHSKKVLELLREKQLEKLL